MEIGSARPDDLRRQNRRAILQAVRSAGALSRTDIGAVAGLSHASVSAITTSLLDAGILREAKGERSHKRQRGRPQVLLEANASAGLIGALALTIKGLAVKLVDYSGRALSACPDRQTLARCGMRPVQRHHRTRQRAALVEHHDLRGRRPVADIAFRPDRTGFTSSESEQLQAAAALVDRMAHRTAAETWSEAASWLPWDESIQAHLRSAGHRLRAWSSGRRAAAWMVNDRMLVATLRPYLAGGVEAPEWVEPELIELLGPGVVTAALDIARREETLPEAEGYFLAAEAEVAVLEGQRERAL